MVAAVVPDGVVAGDICVMRSMMHLSDGCVVKRALFIRIPQMYYLYEKSKTIKNNQSTSKHDQMFTNF